MERRPYAFFYGGYMDPAVLMAAGVSPTDCTAGYIDRLALTIGPIANLEDHPEGRAYGLLARVSHDDLDVLYGGDPSALQGARYFPEAVLVHTEEGRRVPAVTYICPNLPGGPADAAYIAKLVSAAEGLNLPANYVAYLRTFEVLG